MMLRFIVVYLLLFMALFGNEIKLKTGKEFSKGYRIVVNCKIEDPLGVVDARVYFKDKKQKIYHCFSQMKCANGNCKGVLPIPSKYTRSVDYIILYQNSAAKIYKTKKLTISAAEFIALPPWQKFDLERIALKTELLKVPKQLYGFDDKVKIQTIPLELKLGYKAGIYTSEMVGIKDKTLIDGSFEGDVDVSREIIDMKKLKKEGESSSFLSSPYTWIGGGVLVLLVLFL